MDKKKKFSGKTKRNAKHRFKGKKRRSTGTQKKKRDIWIETARGKGIKDTVVEGDVTIVITRVELEEDDDGLASKPLFTNKLLEKSDTQGSKRKHEIDNDDGTGKNTCHRRQDDDGNNKEDESSSIVRLNTKSDMPTNDTPPNQNDNQHSVDNTNSNTIQESQPNIQNKSHSSIVVWRSPQAQGKTKWALQQPKQHNNHKNYTPFSHLPNGDCGDGIINPYPKSKVPDKFWAQRRRLFRRFHDGIQLDEEGWYSVTPEVIADHIASKVSRVDKDGTINSTSQSGFVIMDAFCGCGGDAIAFAKSSRVSLVVAMDTDREKLRMASNNARIYDVPPEKIVFLHADAIEIMAMYQGGKLSVCHKQTVHTHEKEEQDKEAIGTHDTEVCHGFQIGGTDLLPPSIDSIFLSPPWGGMDYIEVGSNGYDIKKEIKVTTNRSNVLKPPPSKENANNHHQKQTIDGETLLQYAMAASTDQNVIYFLPRNVNGISLGRSALNGGYHGIFEMEQNVINGKTKTVTAYFGKFYSKLYTST